MSLRALGERKRSSRTRFARVAALSSLAWTLPLAVSCRGSIGDTASGGHPSNTGGATPGGTGSGGRVGSASGGSNGSGSGGATSGPMGGTGGQTASGGAGATGPTGSGGSPAMPSADCSQPAPGPAPIRRLTRFEYSNTIRDLLGDTTQPGDQLPPELKGNGFSNDATSLTTPRLLVDAYQSVAHDIAVRATKDATTLASTTKCDTTKMSEDACAQSFVADFGARAARRPLDSTESAAILGVYKAARTGAAYADGIAAVIEMVLQSPQFLYRPELGVPVSGANVARVTGYEMATRLSYMLWATMPDQTLSDAAKSGQLETKEQVLAQATRMLKDARVKDVSHFFHNTLLGINGIDGLQRDSTVFPSYTSDLAALFRQETEQFMDYVIWNGQGDFATLFTAPFTF